MVKRLKKPFGEPNRFPALTRSCVVTASMFFLEKIVKINFNNYLLLNEIELVHFFFTSTNKRISYLISVRKLYDFTQSVSLRVIIFILNICEHFMFISLQKSYWFGHQTADDQALLTEVFESSSHEQPVIDVQSFEAEPMGLPTGISIAKLKKVGPFYGNRA